MLEYVIERSLKYLNLRKPVNIELKHRKNKNSMAKYWALINEKDETKSHLIRVYMGNMYAQGYNDRNLNTLVVHELLHAWQEENNFDEIHGPKFQSMAQLLEQWFTAFYPDLNIHRIYQAETDRP